MLVTHISHYSLAHEVCNMQEAPGVDYLINSYPNYVSVDSIPFEDGSIQNKVCLNVLSVLWIKVLLHPPQIELCNSMYQQGLLVIKHHKTN